MEVRESIKNAFEFCMNNIKMAERIELAKVCYIANGSEFSAEGYFSRCISVRFSWCNVNEALF